MDRSSGFGSTPSYYSPYSDSLSLRLPYSVKLATERKSLTHYTKGTQSPPFNGPHPLWGKRLFHSFLLSFDVSRATRSDVKERRPLKGGSHCLYACGFRIYFTPLPGFFSPFPHGTGSLSVDYEYLALEDGPPMFRQDFTCPALLVSCLVPHSCFRVRGYHPLWPDFPDCSTNKNAKS